MKHAGEPPTTSLQHICNSWFSKVAEEQQHPTRPAAAGVLRRGSRRVQPSTGLQFPALQSCARRQQQLQRCCSSNGCLPSCSVCWFGYKDAVRVIQSATPHKLGTEIPNLTSLPSETQGCNRWRRITAYLQRCLDKWNRQHVSHVLARVFGAGNANLCIEGISLSTNTGNE